MDECTLGFLGAGFMAEALARALIAANRYTPKQLRAADIAPERRRVFEEELGIAATDDAAAVVGACRVVLVAVKPQNLGDLLPKIGPVLMPDHLVITICAGAPTMRFESCAARPVRVVRAMPNTPVIARLGATAICPGRFAAGPDLDTAEAIFGAAGIVVRVEEPLMDAVTAVSGSGPAYFYALTEALIEAGRRQGLSEPVARRLAVQTARGAGAMLGVTGQPPEELRRRVTSKGGTTEAALRCMDAGGFPQMMSDAVAAAVRRARELAGG